MRQRGFIGLAVLAAAVVCLLASAGSASAGSCMRFPRTFNPYVLSGAKMTVHVGVTVWAVEGEPESYTRFSPVFPWLAVRTSNAGVLVPVRLCTSKVPSLGIPEHAFAFRAARAGRVTLSAALAPAWRSISHRPRPYRATVTVAR